MLVGPNICALSPSRGLGGCSGDMERRDPVVIHPRLLSQPWPQWTLHLGQSTAGRRGRNPSSESKQTSPRKPGETASNEAINYLKRLRHTPGAQETHLGHGMRPWPAGAPAAEAHSCSLCKTRTSFLYAIYKHTVSLHKLTSIKTACCFGDISLK